MPGGKQHENDFTVSTTIHIKIITVMVMLIIIIHIKYPHKR